MQTLTRRLLLIFPAARPAAEIWRFVRKAHRWACKPAVRMAASSGIEVCTNPRHRCTARPTHVSRFILCLKAVVRPPARAQPTHPPGHTPPNLPRACLCAQPDRQPTRPAMRQPLSDRDPTAQPAHSPAHMPTNPPAQWAPPDTVVNATITSHAKRSLSRSENAAAEFGVSSRTERYGATWRRRADVAGADRDRFGAATARKGSRLINVFFTTSSTATAPCQWMRG